MRMAPSVCGDNGRSVRLHDSRFRENDAVRAGTGACPYGHQVANLVPTNAAKGVPEGRSPSALLVPPERGLGD